jgi:uncharacterized Ntn-hydrolase superfamily protein
MEGDGQMTFSIAGYCSATGAVGVAVATYSLACGARLHAAAGAGAVMSQGFASPALPVEAIRLLKEGLTAPEVMRRLRAWDPDFEWRQVSMVDARGTAVAHTGTHPRAWSGQAEGRDCVACGNVLAGPQVTEAMVRAFETSTGQALPERLLRTLEAARAAGGQVGATGPVTERSAALKVALGEAFPIRDLRVDFSPSAIEALRALHDEFERMAPFYEQRWKQPAQSPPQDLHVRNLQRP